MSGAWLALLRRMQVPIPRPALGALIRISSRVASASAC